jgi:hypothetical protein
MWVPSLWLQGHRVIIVILCTSLSWYLSRVFASYVCESPKWRTYSVLLLALKIYIWSTIHSTLKYNTSLIIGRKWRNHKDHCYYFETVEVKWTTAVTFGMSDFESLNVKLSETDILFLLILNVLDWNITCMLDGVSLFFTCFILCISN